MDLLGGTEMSVEVSAGDVKLGACLHITLAWYRPIRPCSLTSLISIIMARFLPSKISAHPTECGPAKVFPTGARIAKAGPALRQWSPTLL